MSAPPWEWERYRPYLRCRASVLRLDRRLRVGFDESDLVQETLRQAFEHHQDFRGESDAERLAWLEQIQDHLLIDRWRQMHAGKRNIELERRLELVLKESSACWERAIASKEASPSDQAARHELFLRVTSAIDRLRESYRDVVLSVLLLQYTLQEVADQMGLTRGAVAGLYARGLAQLREDLPGLRELSP